MAEKKKVTFCRECFAESICKKHNFVFEGLKECIEMQFSQKKGYKGARAAKGREKEQLKMDFG